MNIKKALVRALRVKTFVMKVAAAKKNHLARLSVMMLSLFFFILLIPAVESRDEHEPGNSDPVVTIDVLSKQVRLLREGSLKEISIAVVDTTIINDTLHNEQVRSRTITVINDSGFRIIADSREVSRPVRIKVDGINDTSTCTVKLQGEERRYPLPLTITLDASGLSFCVTERLSRYALDSARAEYGMAYWKDREAVMALAHIVAARHRYKGKSRSHEHADFCDLTHCQVYRGRTGSDGMDDAWIIDTSALSENLFFHSRCGGNTFDTRIFTEQTPLRGQGGDSVRDYLFQDGTRLCQGPDSHWERSISRDEIVKLLFPDATFGTEAPFAIQYDRKKYVIKVTAGNKTISYPPETFRLIINRVKGWNFLKSNNYTVSAKTTGEMMMCFEGEGLGHGVGFCQKGAVALSRRGYNRYEILEHYYPALMFKSPHSGAGTTPYLSYCVFDLASGSVLSISPGSDFLRRTVPPGSIFKLIVSLYLAAERPDIFNEYTYTCPGTNVRDTIMPDRCWNQHGHGTIQIKDAITYSCNLYFASLYNRISIKNFSAFFSRFCQCTGINARLPEFSNERDWSRMLAGLDFRMTFTIGDYIKLVRFLNCGEVFGRPQASCYAGVPYDQRLVIYRALRETCIRGTAGGVTKPYGADCNYQALPENVKEGTQGLAGDAWGKTATVIDGTNRPVSYGMFIGGAGSEGIVAVLRKSNGHMTARWARVMLEQHKRK
jgi:stage II sporulation protein D